MSTFSERLKWLRNKKGITQSQMAELLGMSARAYAKYEYKLREPNIQTLVKLPHILGESLDFITGVTDRTREIEQLYSSANLYQGTIDTQKEIISRGNMLNLNEAQILEHETQLHLYTLKLKDALRKIKELESEIPKDDTENKETPNI